MLLVLLPGLSAEYGILRLFQQALLMLAPVLALGCLVAVRPLARRRAVDAVLVLLLTVGAVTTGLLAQVLGGYPAQLKLANAGPYYDLYFTTEPEMEGLTWLSRRIESGAVQSEVVTDRYSVRRMAILRRTYTRTNDGFFPSELRKDSYVFVGTDTLTRGRAAVYFGGDLLMYRYPMQILQRHKSVVFDDGVSRVYR